MTTSVLPGKEDVVRLLRDLLGKDVTIAPAKPSKVTPPSVIAAYVDDDKVLVAAVACAIELAASMGAALALIPAPVAAAAAKTGKLEENLWDNAYEVLNVASRWFNSAGGLHLRLRSIQYSKDALPDDLKALVAKPKSRGDFDVAVKGYSAGLMSLLVV